MRFRLLHTQHVSLLLIALLYMVMAWPVSDVKAADTSAQSKIEAIKIERQRLAKVRSQLEGQMGSIGKELRRLDSALIKARKASRQARLQVKETDKRIAELRRQRASLQSRINELKN